MILFATSVKFHKMILSASKIKTLSTCTYLFYTQYVLKLPRTSNKGSDLGTIAHLVLECLLNKRHLKHYENLRKNKTCTKNPVICRLIRKYLVKMGHEDEELKTVDQFLQVALDTDFFLAGFELGPTEYKFEIQNENPKYHILGYIDKYGEKDGVVKITDYKTQKQKFSGKDLTFNVQAMMYILAAKKLWPKTRKAFVNFIMLRFKKNPVQTVTYSDDVIRGFESYLEYLTEYLSDFTYEKAISDMAIYDYSRKMLCGGAEGVKDDGSPKWQCPFKKPFNYYALLDEKGSVVKSEFKKEDLKPKEGQTVKEMSYGGCPYFNR